MGFFVVVASEGACIDLSAHATAARDAVCACKAKGQKKKKERGAAVRSSAAFLRTYSSCDVTSVYSCLICLLLLCCSFFFLRLCSVNTMSTTRKHSSFYNIVFS